MKILVTGATGLVGRNLIRHLLLEGHDVQALARTPQKVFELPAKRVFTWSGDNAPPVEALRGVDAVVHLAGEGIADKRWNEARKKSLVNSRTETTRHLVQALAQMPKSERPKAFIAASAIGFYGDTGEEARDEDSKPGQGFLADLCEQWEKQSQEASKSGMRVVCLRIGIVLAKDGGALAKMGPAVLGSGKQWMSWIHIEDLLRFIGEAVKNESLAGAYNMTSPEPIRNIDFTRHLAKVLSYPLVLPAPAFALKIALGEMAEMLLSSQKILPTRTQATGFKFLYADVHSALQQLFKGNSFLDNHLIVNQFVPLKRREVFPFFSKAENLEILTPPWLNFKITKKSSPEISKNTLIDYRLKIRGVPVRWRTLISDWKPDEAFVDDQLKGPYTKWHHLHLFEEVQGGTLLRDEVTFRVPGSVLGKALLTAWVRRDVETIFAYRRKMIQELYIRGELK